MSNREKLNILLVDDQPAKLLSYEAILDDLGENLIKASSGRKALEILLRNEVTVVLMDVSMPELDGFELAQLIREHPRFNKTAIIFVSAVHLTDLDQLKGYEYGAVDYVSVPVIPEILRAKVRVFTELYRQTQETERLNRELEQRVAERTAELQASTARLRESEEKLREADRRKDEFLALLAHELRNPLAPLSHAVHLMRLGVAGDRELTWTREVIDRQVRQLTRLVDDLLDVSRITRGKIKLESRPLNLSTVITGAVETSRPWIDAGRHELKVTLPDAPLYVTGDLARLTQVVANLLNNAAKYQAEGGTIRLTVQPQEDQAMIVVSDQGIGIEPDKLDTIFDMFSQEDSTLDRAHGGLGIGLALVKNLVEMHDGTVCASSAGRDKGSEFTVRLPCTSNRPASFLNAEDGLETGSTESLRILVVDDNLDAAESLALLLRLRGHEVTIAHDGPQALAVAAREQPGVVLLDIGLPRMNGYEVCRVLRGQGFGSSLVIAMTGYGQQADRRRSQEAGFDAHLIKPVDISLLMKMLATWCRRALPGESRMTSDAARPRIGPSGTLVSQSR